MRVECKWCGKNQTSNMLQLMHNSSIENGIKCYNSKGNLIKYKKVVLCECKK